MSKEEAFVNELIGYIFAYPDDDYMTMECLCRKLHKHGLIERKDGEWTCNFTKQADTPQNEEKGTLEDILKASLMLADLPPIEVMEYPQVEGITPTLVTTEVSEDCDNCIWNSCNYNKVPWEVSEDCISREYLKSFEYINKGDFNSVETIREWIDNAPSVVPKQSELTEAYTRGYKDGAEQTRAKGECPYFIDGVWCNLIGKEMKGAEE